MIKLNEEQQIMVSTVEEFAKRKIEPVAKKIDELDFIPHELYEDLRNMGLMAIQIPHKYGGSELDSVTYALIIEIIAKYSGGLALSLEAHNSLGLAHIYQFGSEQQRELYVPEIINSAIPVAWALTEPQAGSDAKNIQTKAVKKGDHYIITGSKMFITHGTSAQYIVTMAKTESGISAFIVNGTTSGLERNKIKHKLGVRGSDTGELIFHEVEVPVENLLGRENKAFTDVKEILNGGRIAIAAMGVGIAQGALNLALEYMKQRVAFGKDLKSFEALQFKVAELGTEIEGARLLVMQAAMLKDAHKRFVKEASMAKYFASQVAMRTANFAIQIHGGYGYFREFGVDRYLRDAKLLEIGEGTTEIQKIIIARELLR